MSCITTLLHDGCSSCKSVLELTKIAPVGSKFVRADWVCYSGRRAEPARFWSGGLNEVPQVSSRSRLTWVNDLRETRRKHNFLLRKRMVLLVHSSRARDRYQYTKFVIFFWGLMALFIARRISFTAVPPHFMIKPTSILWAGRFPSVCGPRWPTSEVSSRSDRIRSLSRPCKVELPLRYSH